MRNHLFTLSRFRDKSTSSTIAPLAAPKTRVRGKGKTMEDEVPRPVLEVLNGKYLAEGSPKANDVINSLGVYLAGRNDPEQWHYAWRPAVGTPILTIWAEDIRVHPKGWFYIDSLDPVHRRGGGLRTDVQQRRAERRVQILEQMRDDNEECIGLLQTNQLRIADLERNAIAKVSKRVVDDVRWHVAHWDEAGQRAILVRGETTWVPTAEDIAALPAVEGEEPESDDGAPELVFPNKDHRDRVEEAAIRRVRRHYESSGYLVEDVSSKNLGYDLEVIENGSGKAVLHIEVKGTSMTEEAFFITANEYRCSEKLETWRLVIVTSALDQEPQMRAPLTASQMMARFRLDPLAWRATRK